MDNIDALIYVEKYGIIDYKLHNNILTYHANYPAYLNNKKYTVKVIYNLKTGEEKRRILRYWSNKGKNNLYK